MIRVKIEKKYHSNCLRGRKGESTLKDSLKHELNPPECFNFQQGIQRANQSLAQKPTDGAPLRPPYLIFWNAAPKRVFFKRNIKKKNRDRETACCPSITITLKRLCRG